MAPDNQDKSPNRIPIRFVDNQNPNHSDEADALSITDDEDENEMITDDARAAEETVPAPENPSNNPSDPVRSETSGSDGLTGPQIAELVATRAELKRVQGEVAELNDRLARRQADFDNYRKRVERERSDSYNRSVGDIALKLLPVLDNLKRALETEASVEASESDEFRHFLSGVDLIYKQLNGVLDALGVKPIPAVGEPFNPHIHEAVISEQTDEYEPDTIIQEIVAGYRLGDKLIRPALVKVAVRG
ncbi:MAG: nucleotide exchange factor GrpE [Pyrinomonadaceae bacterium]